MSESIWNHFCGQELKTWTSKGYIDKCFRNLTITYPTLSILAIISAYLYGYSLTKHRITRSKSQLLILKFRIAFSIILPIFSIIQIISLHFFAAENACLFLTDYVECGLNVFAWILHFMYLNTLKCRGVTLNTRGILWANLTVFLVGLSGTYNLLCVLSDLKNNFEDSVKLFYTAFDLGFIACYLITLIPKEYNSNELSSSEEAFFNIPSTSGGISGNRNYGSINYDYVRTPSPTFDFESDKPNWFSRLTFWWVFPLLSRGARGTLDQIDNLFNLPEDMKVKYINESFIKNENINKFNTDKIKHYLANQLNKTFGFEFYFLIILKLITDALNFSGPIFLNLLLNFLEAKSEPIKNGILYAFGMSFASLLAAFFATHFSYRVNYVAIKVKTAVIGCIYRKTLAVTSTSLNAFNTGEIVNFMSCDADRISNYCQSFHELWSLPVQVVVALYLLYQQIGLSFLVGLAYTVLLIPINKWLANKIGFLSQSRMDAKDGRIKLMNEAIASIRVIKMNAWEPLFVNDIVTARKREMHFLKKRQYLDALCVFFWAATPVIISVSTFSLYSLLGNQLTAAKIFTSLTLFEMIRKPLNAFPWVLNGFVEAWISLKRVERFLKLENFDANEYFSEITGGNQNVLEMKDAVFSWKDEETSTENVFTLGPINLDLSMGQLIGVIGEVGSGKTSLLLGVIGESYLNDGEVFINTKLAQKGVAYVPQDHFLMHATLQDNILFGKPMNYLKYNMVLKACALLDDLKSLPNGDLTEIGERGISLSGGQKARISLARAVYQDLDLYLLDDPFSAVDVHVGEHIYNYCIKGLLKNKAVILCTHHTRFLQDADSIISLKNGEVQFQGKPIEILPVCQTLGLKSNEVIEEEATGSKPGSKEQSPEPAVGNNLTRLVEEEGKETGSVKLSIYKLYCLAVGKWLTIIVLTCFLLMTGSKVFSDWWLNYWISHDTTDKNGTAYNITDFADELTKPNQATTFNFYLYVFIGTGVLNSIFTLLRAFSFAYGGICAAISFHDKLLNTVIKAPIYFFDKTPLGRILNRFSSDLNMIDDTFPFILNIFVTLAFNVPAAIIVTCYGIQWMILLFIPLSVAYYYIQNFYRHTSREIKRLSSVSLSPIYEHFSETIDGLITIRALSKSKRFINENEVKVETNERALFSGLAVAQWLSLFLQLIGVAVVTGMASMAIAQHYYSGVNPGQIGLAMSYALTVTALLNGLVSSFTECEKEIVSVERIAQYLDVKSEKIHGIMKPLGFWPTKGVISFENVHLRYHKGYLKALNGVSFETRPSEKIGIVGRTGSGKSSLYQALFRLVELEEGKITIDGINIAHLDLHLLRSNLSIVPQDPILFSGSVRKNLDPANVIQDSVLWKVLRQCKISGAIHQLGGFDTELGEKALSLSAGQRQLFCLARVLLSSSKICCFDEATANVDAQMDKAIQEIISQEFRDTTLLIIAHRIQTIMLCDRVIVMGDGNVLEIGAPTELMKNKRSNFYSLVNRPNLND